VGVLCLIRERGAKEVSLLAFAGPTEVLFISGKQTQWLDYLPSPAIALAATNVFCAVAMADGSLNVYSHTGRK
jgi:protein HIRA/HIR1